MRAGIARWGELPYCDDDGKEIIGSRVKFLAPDTTGETRWLTLLACALKDAVAESSPQVLREVPVVVAMPGGPDKPMKPAVLVRRLSKLGVELEARNVQTVASGAPGAFRAIALGRALLEEGRHQACMVAAADSLVDARSLLDLSKGRRLRVSGEADRVIPGEAAACLLLARREARRGARGEKGPKALAVIRGVGFGEEPALRSNDVPLRADGLTMAARAALQEAGLAFHDMDLRLSDAAGDSYAFKEQSLVVTRLLRKSKESFPLWLSADSLGDVGAAASLCGIASAVAAFQRGYAPGPRAIAFTSSESGARAAVVLEKGEE